MDWNKMRARLEKHVPLVAINCLGERVHVDYHIYTTDDFLNNESEFSVPNLDVAAHVAVAAHQVYIGFNTCIVPFHQEDCRQVRRDCEARQRNARALRARREATPHNMRGEQGLDRTVRKEAGNGLD